MAEQQSFDRDLAKISRTPATSWTPETIHLAAASLGPNIIVAGTLEKKDATFFVNLSAVRVSDRVVVETESFDMHISEFQDSLSSSAPGKDDDSVNHAGLNGIGMPSCIHCPDPS